MSFNLSVILREAASRTPDRTAVVSGSGNLSYRDLDQRSDAVASELVRLGVRPGEAVGIQLPNVPEFVATLYGVLKAGAVAIPMNVLNKAPEIAYFLQHSKANVLVTVAGLPRRRRPCWE